MEKPLPPAFSPEDLARRRRRSIAMAVVLVVLIGLFFSPPWCAWAATLLNGRCDHGAPVQPNANKNRRVAVMAASVVIGMVGLAYASVPLYRLFCQVTGFGGTTQVAASAPATISGKSISVRFDANIDKRFGLVVPPRCQHHDS